MTMTTTATTDPIAAAVAPVADDILAAAPKPAGRTWYSINNNAEADDEVEAEVMIYDEIGGWGIQASQFVRDFKAIDAGRIRLRINSPGGSVTEAVAIFNAIREHEARIIAHVDGLAASAASVIAMAGDEVRMADNAYLMIHEARGVVMGDAADFQRYADLLEKMNDNIAGAYQKKSGKPKSHWRKLMADETWFTAKEAKAEGLVDAVYTAEKPLKETARAGFNFTIYNRVPAEVLAAFQAQQTTAPEASSCDDPPPAVHTKENLAMANDSQTQVAPATNPAAGTPQTSQGNDIKSLNEQAVSRYRMEGREIGRKEEREAQLARIEAVIDACPGKPDMAIAALRSGQSAESARVAFQAASEAEKRAQARINELEAENLRQQQLIALGGHPGVSLGVTNSGAIADDLDGIEPKVRAEKEWDRDCGPDGRPVRSGFSSKANYVAIREAELKGQFCVSKK